MTLSIGLAGGLGPARIAELAPLIEDAGFAALWVNDTPDGDAIAALAAAARVTSRLRLATGVVPIDRRPAAALIADIRASRIPEDRLTLGLGSGGLRRGTVDTVAAAVDEVRLALDAEIVVGALGPRMRRLAVERADGVLLNWVTPDEAGRQAEALHDAAPETRVSLYVRTALDAAASARLAEETARYASFPNYAANFARMGVDASDTVIDGVDALRERLPHYLTAVDEVVLRAIAPDDSREAYVAFIRAVVRVGRPDEV